MGADSPRNRGSQPAWKAAAGAADTRRDPQYNWKPAEAATPGTGGRRLKQSLLIGGSLACLGGIVWLILLLLPTPQPCFVAIAADPAADAARLDVPLDLYGWRTANEFLTLGRSRAEQSTRWVGKPPVPPTDEGNPLRLPETEAGLPDWANRIKHFDPLVIYVGLHGGTDGANQPVLFTGGRGADNRPNRLPVAALIQTLTTAPLQSSKKVLILDCGRLTPDPLYGQIHDHFAARIRDLSPAIAADPNLVVMCGAPTGQRGWESEELRVTSFGHAVLDSLRGKIDEPLDNNVITAKVLYESARRKTLEWSQNNRPTVQEPFLLPEGEDGLNRAAEIDLGPKPAAPSDDSTPTPADLPPTLDQFWSDHDSRQALTPGPAAYAPRAWRRFRELLLRYEQAVRLGEQQAATALATAIRTTRDEIDQAAALDLSSSRNSIALWAATNGGGNITTDADLASFPSETDRQMSYAARAFRQFDNSQGNLSERLARLATLLKKFEPPDRRPVEAHLPVMAEDFYTAVLGQPAPNLPAEWITAFEVRLLAERAAAGLPMTPRDRPGSAAVYPERCWPVIAESVLQGDRNRRQAEDALFASDARAHAQAAALLRAARQDYARAATIAQDLQTAFAVRDSVLADLPFLTRWQTERFPSAREASGLIDLWDRTHALAAALDELAINPPTDISRSRKVADDARLIANRFEQFKTEFLNEVNRAQSDAALQAEWWAKQRLLTVPMMTADQRKQILAASRQVSARLLSGQQKQEIAAARIPIATRSSTEVRGKLARAVLGSDLLNTQHDADPTLPKADILDRDLTAIATAADDAQWPGPATQVGAGLAGHYARLSAEQFKPSPTPQASIEKASRSAVPFDPASGWEPAAVNYRLNWRMYLTAQAERTADDHWYDEKQSPVPYFRSIAKRFTDDVSRLTADLTSRTPQGEAGGWNAEAPSSLLAKLSAPPLTARDMAPITWTSEPVRTVPFELGSLPEDYPVSGSAVAVGRFKELAPIQAAGTSLARPLLPLSGESLGLKAELLLDLGVEEAHRPDCRAACTVYFRGQRPTQAVTIHLQRKPDLVIANPPPAENVREPFVAIRADRDLDLGSVVILLDYSDSMNHNYQKGKSRKTAALEAVATLLQELPKGTPLRIRVFSEKDNWRGSQVVYPDPSVTEPAKVTWDSTLDRAYKDLLARLNGLTPYGYTPLTQSIIEAVTNDFAGQSGGSKTLLVLTDGAEEDGTMRRGDAKTAFIAGKAAELMKELKDKDIYLHVVQFGVNKEDQKAATDLFKPLQDARPEQVRLWNSQNVTELTQTLTDALRPKLKLTGWTGDLPTRYDFPRTGWPARPVTRPAPPYASYTPHWSPRIETSLERPYRIMADPAELPSQSRLNLRDGERMILLFSKAGARVRIERELYADYLPYPELKVRSGNDRWLLTAPSSVLDDELLPPALLSRAYLEEVPPHRRTKGNRTTEIETLEFAHPELTWWQVTPVVAKGDKPKRTGTLRITRTYGYPAPTWDIQANDWPRQPLAAAEINIWAADDTPYAMFETCRPNEARTLTTEAGDRIEMRTTIEKWKGVGFKEPTDCLVVRFAFEKGKPYMVRPVELAAYAEHRYYGDGTGADGMIAYTAVFNLPLDRVKTAGMRLKLMPVQPCLTDAGRMTLVTPTPRVSKTVYTDSLPQPYDLANPKPR